MLLSSKIQNSINEIDILLKNDYRFGCITTGFWCRDLANAGDRTFSRNMDVDEWFLHDFFVVGGGFFFHLSVVSYWC